MGKKPFFITNINIQCKGYILEKSTSQQKGLACFSTYKSWVWDFFFHTAGTAETTTFAAVKHEKRNWDLSKGISPSLPQKKTRRLNNAQEQHPTAVICGNVRGMINSEVWNYQFSCLFSTWFLRPSFVGIFFCLSFLWCKNLVEKSVCLSVGGGKSQVLNPYLWGDGGEGCCYYCSTKEPMLPHQRRDQYRIL